MENPIEKMENFEFLNTYAAAIDDDDGGSVLQTVQSLSFVRTFDSDAQWCLGSWGSSFI